MYGEVITVGIILSLAFSTLTGLSPAGLIVPGYLALSLSSPYKLLWTMAVVFITLGIYRIISRYTILYGRRRFAVMVVVSLAVGWLIAALPLPGANIGVIGYLIPFGDAHRISFFSADLRTAEIQSVFNIFAFFVRANIQHPLNGAVGCSFYDLPTVKRFNH